MLIVSLFPTLFAYWLFAYCKRFCTSVLCRWLSSQYMPAFGSTSGNILPISFPDWPNLLYTYLWSCIFIGPDGPPFDILLFLGELNPWGVDGTNRLELLLPLVLNHPWKNFINQLDQWGTINEWHKRTMDKNICLCMHINKTVMCTIEIGAIVGILPAHTLWSWTLLSCLEYPTCPRQALWRCCMPQHVGEGSGARLKPKSTT